MPPALSTISSFGEIFGGGSLGFFNNTSKQTWPQYEHTFGIVIQPFDPPTQYADFCIKLSLGDLVLIKGENEGWYKGERFPSMLNLAHPSLKSKSPYGSSRRNNSNPGGGFLGSSSLSDSDPQIILPTSPNTNAMMAPTSPTGIHPTNYLSAVAASSNDNVGNWTQQHNSMIITSSDDKENSKSSSKRRKNDSNGGMDQLDKTNMTSKGFFPATHVIRFDGSPNNPFSLNYQLSTGIENNPNRQSLGLNQEITIAAIQQQLQNLGTSMNSQQSNFLSPRSDDGTRNSQAFNFEEPSPRVISSTSSNAGSPNNPFLPNDSSTPPGGTSGAVGSTVPPITVSSSSNSSLQDETNNNSIISNSILHETALSSPRMTTPQSLPATNLFVNSNISNSAFSISDSNLHTNGSGHISPTLASNQPQQPRSKSFRRGLMNSFSVTKQKLENIMSKDKSYESPIPSEKSERKPLTPTADKRQSIINESSKNKRASLNLSGMNLSNVFSASASREEFANQRTSSLAENIFSTGGNDTDKLLSPKGNHDRKRSQSIASNATFAIAPKNANIIISNALIALGNVFPEQIYAQSSYLGASIDVLQNMSQHYQKEIVPFLEENWFSPFLAVPFCKSMIETVYEWNLSHFESLVTQEDNRDRFMRVFEIEAKMVNYLIDYYSYQRREDSENFKSRMKEILKSQVSLREEGASLFSEDVVIKKNGEKLSPLNTPLFNLYKMYWETIDKEENNLTLTVLKSKRRSYSRIPEGNSQLAIEIGGCSYYLKVEWRFSLYDISTKSFLSEDLVIFTSSTHNSRVSVTGPEETFEDNNSDNNSFTSHDDDDLTVRQRQNLYALFKDVSRAFIEKEQMLILVRAFRMERVKLENPINGKHFLDCRVPMAVGVSPKLTKSVVSELASGVTLKHEINFFNFKSNDNLDSFLDQVMNDDQNLEREDIMGIDVSLSMVTGDYHKAYKQYPQLSQLPLVPMTRFSSSIISDDIRNDIYINVKNVLNKNVKTLYVEAKMYIKGKEGITIQCDINRKQRVYRSAIVRMKNPSWSEILLVNVNSHQLQSAIIVFEFYVVNTKKNAYEISPDFFAYFHVDDGTRTLTLGNETQIDPLPCYDFTKGFTNIHEFDINEVLKQKCQKKAKLCLAVNVVSTSIAINPNLRDFLKWDIMDETNIQSIINNIDFKTVDTTICFREIMTSFLGIANKYGKSRSGGDSFAFIESQLLQKVFEKVCILLAQFVDSPETSISIIEDFKKSLQYSLSHRFILFYLNKHFDLIKLDDMTVGTKEKLIRSIKSLNYLLKIAESSLINFKRKYPQLGEEELKFVQNELSLMNIKLNQLIQKPETENSIFKSVKNALFDTMTPDFFTTVRDLFNEHRLGRIIEKFSSAIPADESYRKLHFFDNIISSEPFQTGSLSKNLYPMVIEALEGYSECFLESKSISIMNKIIHLFKARMSHDGKSFKSSFGLGDLDLSSSKENETERMTVVSDEETDFALLGKQHREKMKECSKCLIDFLGLLSMLKEAFDVSLERTEELEAEYSRERTEQETSSQTLDSTTRDARTNNSLITKKFEPEINQAKRLSCDIIVTIVNFLDLLTFKGVLDMILEGLNENSQLAELDAKDLLIDLVSIVLSKKNPLPKNWTQLNIYQYGTIANIILMIFLKLKKYISSMEGCSITTIHNLSQEKAVPVTSPRAEFNVSRIVKLSQMLVRYLFEAIFSFEPEKMPSYDRKLFLSQNDTRPGILQVFYDCIWSVSPLQLQESLLPDLIEKTIRLFKIHVCEVTNVAKNLFFDLLKLEYISRNSLSLCEAATERFFSEVSGQEGVRRTFISCVESKLKSYKDLMEELLGPEAVDEFSDKMDVLLESLHHLLKQIRDIEAASTNDPNTMNFQNQEKSFKNALKSFKKNSNVQLYFKYLHLLASMQKSRKRYIEAGLAIFQHAQMLNFESQTELPLFSDNYPDEPECKRKIKLYKEVIDLFEKGKDWERAISLNEELRTIYKNMMNYSDLSVVHSEESKLYKKIVTSIREYNKYYFVGFYGKSMSNTNFIFNAHHQKLADFVNFIKLKFKGATIKREIPSSFDESKFRTTEQQVIFLAPVEPSSQQEINSFVDESNEDSFKLFDPQVSPKIQQYHKSHNIKVFKRVKVKREQAEEKSSSTGNIDEPKQSMDDQDGSIFFFTIKKPFPNMYTIQEVREKKLFKLNSLEVAIYYLELRIHAVQELVISHKLNESNLLTASLDSELTGLIDPRIHGGIYKDVERYLAPEALENLSEENLLLIEKYKIRLSQLAYQLKEGLTQRRKHVSKQNLQMSVYLEKKFKNDLIPLLEKHSINCNL